MEICQLLSGAQGTDFRTFVAKSLCTESLEVRSSFMPSSPITEGLFCPFHDIKRRPTYLGGLNLPIRDVYIPSPLSHFSSLWSLSIFISSLTLSIWYPFWWHWCNPKFYEVVESFRKIDSISDRISTAQTIYDTFIKAGSPQEINVDYDVRLAIKKDLSEASKTLFDAAQQEVLLLLSLDVLPKYYNSYVLPRAIFYCLVDSGSRGQGLKPRKMTWKRTFQFSLATTFSIRRHSKKKLTMHNIAIFHIPSAQNFSLDPNCISSFDHIDIHIPCPIFLVSFINLDFFFWDFCPRSDFEKNEISLEARSSPSTIIMTPTGTSPCS